MVDIYNSKSTISEFSEAKPGKLPPLKQKVIKKPKVPHYPNVDVPMSEKEINDFKKKYPNRTIDYKGQKPEGSEQIELKNIFSSSNPLDNNDIYDNAPDVISKNSIVGDIYLEEDRTNNYIKGYYYHKLGNCLSFLADSNGNPLFIVGRKYFIYFIISVPIQILFWFGITYYKKELEQGFIIFGYIIVLIFQIIYTLAFISNPGFPKNTLGRMKGIPRGKHKYCSECSFYIELSKKVKHCFTCGICIEGYHKHSLLINKCVGRRNIVIFYIFVIFLIMNICYLICLIILSNR